jgi:hypothetical protein
MVTMADTAFREASGELVDQIWGATIRYFQYGPVHVRSTRLDINELHEHIEAEASLRRSSSMPTG